MNYWHVTKKIKKYVSNEIHFLWSCEQYEEERQVYFEGANIPITPSSDSEKLCLVLDNDNFYVTAKY